MLCKTHYDLGPAAVRSLAMVCSAAEALDVHDPELLDHLSNCIQRVPLSKMRPARIYILSLSLSLSLPLSLSLSLSRSLPLSLSVYQK
jgi:hypothetical protein